MRERGLAYPAGKKQLLKLEKRREKKFCSPAVGKE